jgi:sugar/nucleoside kinase (ribokinase family)
MSKQNDELLQRVTEHRLKTGQGMSMNPSMEQIEERSRSFQASLKLLDVIFLNLQEALRLARLSQGADMAVVFRSIHSLGVKTVCITDGERGAWVSNQNHIWQAGSVCDRACRVDATGAGDAFAAGFLAGYIEADEELDDDVCQKSLEMAMLNSGSVVEGIGAQETLLTSREIEQDLGKVKIKVIR